MTEIRDVINRCSDACGVVREMEQALYHSQLTSLCKYGEREVTIKRGKIEWKEKRMVVVEDGDPGIIRLEANLFHLGALPDVAHGVFYMLPVKVGNFIVVRYVNSVGPHFCP